MQQTIDPSLEFDWEPAGWAAMTMVAISIVAIFGLHRPGVMLAGAVVAGGVAGALSDFYEQSGNNGLVGVSLGLGGLVPIFVVRRLAEFWGFDAVGDVIFLTAVQVLADIFVYVWFMPVFGYLGGVVVDIARRRLDGPIGY